MHPKNRGLRIFISHAHQDAALADALRDLYVTTFGENVQPRYSSDRSPGGGPPPGAPWLGWIKDEVKQADRTLVLLTRHSVGRPWLLWESGAVTGAALASERSKAVVPLLFKLNPDQIPEPLRGLQLLHGDAAEDIERELEQINLALGDVYTKSALKAVAAQFVPLYLGAVAASLADASRGAAAEREDLPRSVIYALAVEAFLDKLNLHFKAVSFGGFGTTMPGAWDESERPRTNAFGKVVTYDPRKSGSDGEAELRALITKISHLRATREGEILTTLLALFTEVQARASSIARQLRKVSSGHVSLADAWNRAQDWLLDLWKELSRDFASFDAEELDRLRQFLESHPSYSAIHEQEKKVIEDVLALGKVSLDELLVLTADALPKFLARALEAQDAHGEDSARD